jgi:hypothetical protein
VYSIRGFLHKITTKRDLVLRHDPRLIRREG